MSTIPDPTPTPHYYWAPKYQIGSDMHWALCDTASDKEGKVSCCYMVLLANYRNAMDGRPVGKQDMPARIAALLNGESQAMASVIQLGRDNRELAVKLTQVEADRDREAKKVDDLERQLAAAREERHDHLTRLSIAKEENAGLRAQLATATAELQKAEKDKTDLGAKVTEYVRKLDLLEHENNVLKAALQAAREDGERLRDLVALQEQVVNRVCEKHGWKSLEDGANKMARALKKAENAARQRDAAKGGRAARKESVDADAAEDVDPEDNGRQ